MAIIWDKRNDRFYFELENTRDSSEEHSELMKIFHEFYPSGSEMETPEHNLPALVESGQYLLCANTITATGGSRSTTTPADWLPLIPMWRIALRRFSDN